MKRDLDLAIAYFLRFGVMVGALLMSFGLGLQLMGAVENQRSADQWAQTLLSGQFLAQVPVPLSVNEMRQGFQSLSSDTFIGLGIVVLMALPVGRLILIFFLFLMKRDWVYLGISALVLSILLGSWVFRQTF
ncbi:MAG: DUF1634 domain-containing protein [Bdellovibrionia bacterium]